MYVSRQGPAVKPGPPGRRFMYPTRGRLYIMRPHFGRHSHGAPRTGRVASNPFDPRHEHSNMTPQAQAKTKVFISYSHEDRKWLDRLNVHLKPLRLNEELWDDTRIEAGMKWRDEIDRALADARVAVLLVSPDFLASEFISDVELPALVESASARGTRILTVILGPIRAPGETEPMLPAVKTLLQFQTVNDPDSPLKEMEDVKQDEVWVTLRYLVQLALRQQQPQPATPGPGVGREPAQPKKAEGDCRDYADIFDIYVESGRKTVPLLYAAAVAAPLVGIALILAAWLMPQFNASAPLLASMTAVGAAACGLSFLLLKKIVEAYASIKSCEFMRRRFERCADWEPAELVENIKLATEFLRKGMAKS